MPGVLQIEAWHKSEFISIEYRSRSRELLDIFLGIENFNLEKWFFRVIPW
jgi:hypothetical protein